MSTYVNANTTIKILTCSDMRILWIDFETRSELDVGDVGSHAYAMHRSTEMILCAYAFDDDEVQVAECLPGIVRDAIEDDSVLKVAHNAEFDMCIAKYVLGIDISYNDWFDTAYLAAYYGLPRKLAYLANVLGATQKASQEEMLFFSVPVRLAVDKNPGQWFFKPTPTVYNEGKDHPEKWHLFTKYAVGDVRTMRECKELMGTLPRIEVFVMRITFEMNFNGVSFDTKLARDIKIRAEEYEEKAGSIALEKYGIDNLRSNKQVLRALSLEGIHLTSLDKKNRGNHTHEILDLRDQSSGAAFSKIPTAFKRLCPDNRLHGEFVGFGAHTGRWSSRGTQLQNWARITDKVDESLQGVKSYSHLRMHMRLCLGHTMGQSFTFADLSQIEARIVAWGARCRWRLEAFADNEDIYARSAERIFNKPVVTRDDPERFMGKTYELALGFGGGHKSVENMSWEFYQKRGEAKVREDVKSWRYANPEIVRLWYALQDAFIQAVKVGRAECIFGSKTLVFTFNGKHASVLLPSGRCLHYRDVQTRENDFGSIDITYQSYAEKGGHATTSKLWGGSILENVAQGLARDVIAHIMCNVKRKYPYLFLSGTVHDEIWFNHATRYVNALQDLLNEMSEPIAWAPGLVITGEGFTSDRYRK